MYPLCHITGPVSSILNCVSVQSSLLLELSPKSPELSSSPNVYFWNAAETLERLQDFSSGCWGSKVGISSTKEACWERLKQLLKAEGRELTRAAEGTGNRSSRKNSTPPLSGLHLQSKRPLHPANSHLTCDRLHTHAQAPTQPLRWARPSLNSRTTWEEPSPPGEAHRHSLKVTTHTGGSSAKTLRAAATGASSPPSTAQDQANATQEAATATSPGQNTDGWPDF